MKTSTLNFAKNIGLLYHSTSLENALSILKSGVILPVRNSRIDLNKKSISFTRDKYFDITAYRRYHGNFNRNSDSIVSNSVIFVFDGNKLSDRYHVESFLDSFCNKGECGTSGSEEVIKFNDGKYLELWNDDKKLKPYFLKIIVRSIGIRNALLKSGLCKDIDIELDKTGNKIIRNNLKLQKDRTEFVRDRNRNDIHNFFKTRSDEREFYQWCNSKGITKEFATLERLQKLYKQYLKETKWDRAIRYNKLGFSELTKRLKRLNFSEYKYWVIYHKGNPVAEMNANRWIKMVMGNPNLYSVELVEQGTDIYKLSCNNKSKLLSLYGNIDIIDSNVLIKENDHIIFKQIGEWSPDDVLSMTPKSYNGNGDLKKWSDTELVLSKNAKEFLNLKVLVKNYDFVECK